MVAETEDLLLEYYMIKEATTNLCVKEGEEESPCGRMRKPHFTLRDWSDDTFRIQHFKVNN